MIGDFVAWRKVKAIAERIASSREDKIYVAKDYTKGDLRRDLLAVIPEEARIEGTNFDTVEEAMAGGPNNWADPESDAARFVFGRMAGKPK